MKYRNIEKELYRDAKSYIECEEGMDNEISMWYVAGGIFLKEIIKQKVENSFGEIKEEFESIYNASEKINIIDFCCGPAVFPKYLKLFYSNLNVVGIDINKNFIDYSRNTFSMYGWKFIVADAITYNFGKKFDFVTGSSAYHHIPDEFKIVFLKNMKKHLNPNGRILLCENFLPDYSSNSEKEDAIKKYYYELKKYYTNGGGTELAAKVVDELVEMEISNNEEHKVSFNIFQQHIKSAGLLIEKNIHVWNQKSHNYDSGSRVLLLKISY